MASEVKLPIFMQVKKRIVIDLELETFDEQSQKYIPIEYVSYSCERCGNWSCDPGCDKKLLITNRNCSMCYNTIVFSDLELQNHDFVVSGKCRFCFIVHFVDRHSSCGFRLIDETGSNCEQVTDVDSL